MVRAWCALCPPLGIFGPEHKSDTVTLEINHHVKLREILFGCTSGNDSIVELAGESRGTLEVVRQVLPAIFTAPGCKKVKCGQVAVITIEANNHGGDHFHGVAGLLPIIGDSRADASQSVAEATLLGANGNLGVGSRKGAVKSFHRSSVLPRRGTLNDADKGNQGTDGDERVVDEHVHHHGKQRGQKQVCPRVPPIGGIIIHLENTPFRWNGLAVWRPRKILSCKYMWYGSPTPQKMD